MSFSVRAPLSLVMPALLLQKVKFFLRSEVFWQKQYLHSKQQYEGCVDFFSSVFSFSQIKSCYQLKLSNYRPCIWNPASSSSKSTISWKNDNSVIHNLPARHRCQFFLTLSYFSYQVQLLVQVSCCISTGSRVMTVFVFKGFVQKWENQKYSNHNFNQYLETGVSQVYQIWHDCLQ